MEFLGNFTSTDYRFVHHIRKLANWRVYLEKYKTSFSIISHLLDIRSRNWTSSQSMKLALFFH